MKRLEHASPPSHCAPESLKRSPRQELSRFHEERQADSSLIGQVVGRHFVVIEKIGEGGNGEVYRAMDCRTGRDVALKIAGSKYEQEKMNQFVKNEASVLSRVSHENVVGYVADGLHEGRRYVALEYLEGSSLDKLLEGPACMTSERAINIVIQVCDALGAVHEAGYMHRDIKPGNIFVTNRDKVKLIDFGISEAIENPPDRDVGVIVGTASYLAPETISGLHYDQRVDVYATGVLLYRAITGMAPFEGKDILEIMNKHVSSPPKSLREISGLKIPHELEGLILKALEKDPDERFQSMREMKSGLESCPRWTVLVPADSLGFRQTELHDTIVEA